MNSLEAIIRREFDWVSSLYVITFSFSCGSTVTGAGRTGVTTGVGTGAGAGIGAGAGTGVTTTSGAGTTGATGTAEPRICFTIGSSESTMACSTL